tara:strand:+ start:289 stop:1242 length:954 start_codon:yes stop_codon:yes gene_type:complete
MLFDSNKSKQYLLLALKVIILAVTFGYIYVKLTQDTSLAFKDFAANLSFDRRSVLFLLLFVLLAAANWFFEILKWQTAISIVAPIPFKTALQQSLSALTVSLATPNRIGDYGAKIMYFPSDKRKQILLLSFFSNVVQMSITCVFGLIGVIYIVPKFSIEYSTTNLILFLICILLLGIVAYLFKERQLLMKGLSIASVLNYLRKIEKSIKMKVGVYSMLRYMIFSFLFYLLLLFFGAEISFSEAIPLLFSMYLFVSVIPTIFILDLVVRGGVAVWLFSLVGVSELAILSTVLSMWLLNFVFPAIWGSFYVANFKLETG